MLVWLSTTQPLALSVLLGGWQANAAMMAPLPNMAHLYSSFEKPQLGMSWTEP